MSKKKADILEQITTYSFNASEAELKAAITVLSAAFKNRFTVLNNKPKTAENPATRRRSTEVRPTAPQAQPQRASNEPSPPPAAGYNETKLATETGGK